MLGEVETVNPRRSEPSTLWLLKSASEPAYLQAGALLSPHWAAAALIHLFPAK